MTLEEMKNKKTELGLTNEMISQSSGIPLSTIQKIMSGATKAPRRVTLEAIETVLLSEEQKKERSVARSVSEKSGIRYEPLKERPSYAVKEAMPNYNTLQHFESDKPYEVDGNKTYPSENNKPYAFDSDKPYTTINRSSSHAPQTQTEKKDGEYTLDDYYALPDERRVELIDGVFYDMAAPAVIHQKILGELFVLFRECADAREGECEVFVAPCDVRLDCDNKTMVQPDIFLICHPYDLGAKALDGAPDLTLEILSPATRAKDMLLKLHKYQNAGVKEYWIVDPDHDTVLVYDLRSDDFYPEKYDFDSVIPIHISEGKCSIDFSRVSSALARVRSAGLQH
ncbi:MAG: Uma2 family endonuclease [Lachnospiraceae bacterium]|nr:Uma2 family endonuclease [Lachnospiraceae bacterium]